MTCSSAVGQSSRSVATVRVVLVLNLRAQQTCAWAKDTSHKLVCNTGVFLNCSFEETRWGSCSSSHVLGAGPTWSCCSRLCPVEFEYLGRMETLWTIRASVPVCDSPHGEDFFPKICLEFSMLLLGNSFEQRNEGTSSLQDLLWNFFFPPLETVLLPV